MTLEKRHILLLVGITAVILSFLFFGRATKTYEIVLFSGLVLSMFSYFAILFSDPVRNKIIWTLIVVGGIALQIILEPFMIELSYSYFVKLHEKDLLLVNQILVAKQPNTMWTNDSTSWERHRLTMDEGRMIGNLVENKNISLIEMDTAKIYFRTYGMLDISHGVFYFYTAIRPDKRFRHLKGNWYY